MTIFELGSFCKKHFAKLAVVAAQLAERSLPTSETRGLNPNIGNVFFENIFAYLSIAIQKSENKEKEAGIGPFFRKTKNFAKQKRR